MASESKVEEGSRKELKNKNAENLAKWDRWLFGNLYIWVPCARIPRVCPKLIPTFPRWLGMFRSNAVEDGHVIPSLCYAFGAKGT